MKRNKKERAAAKVAAVSTETVNNIKDAVNVGSHDKAKTSPEAEKPKKVKAVKKIELKADKPTKTVTPKDQKSLDSKTALSVAKEITDKKELKYIYPDTATTLDTRKKFRAEVRRKMAAQEKEIAKLMASTLKEDQTLLEAKSKEFDLYRAKVIQAPAIQIPS